MSCGMKIFLTVPLLVVDRLCVLTFVVYEWLLLLLSWGSRKYENSDTLKVP